MANVLRIGNAQAFWGDDSTAAARLAAQVPELDWLTLDYLAEVSMSILAKQRERDPSAGYARDFLEVVASLVPVWQGGRKLRVITNAGGLNPAACAQACIDLLRQAGCRGVKVGIVSGDDVLDVLRTDPANFQDFAAGAPLSAIADTLITANAYLGAEPIAEAIAAGADLIITGRVADPSLTVAPCVAHFGWSWSDYDRLAGATVAGHLIECGTQVTGGISTDWMGLPDPADIGFPVAEVHADGSCVITKPPNTGGRVAEQTVKEQLLYEIGDPNNYLSPDVTVSFLSLRVVDEGDNRVRVSGATGRAPPQTYKVSVTHRAGFRASGMLTIFGRDAVAKAQRCGQIVLQRLRRAGCEPQRSWVECLGAGSVVPGVLPASCAGAVETVLRITVADPSAKVVERFTKELMPLITSGPQGVTGYAEGRPAVREMFGYCATLIPRAMVRPQVLVLEA
ncbi:MAG: acyclic terpene utilization AtuA family protein [Tepidisphaeraceae bacterium]